MYYLVTRFEKRIPNSSSVVLDSIQLMNYMYCMSYTVDFTFIYSSVVIIKQIPLSITDNVSIKRVYLTIKARVGTVI